MKNKILAILSIPSIVIASNANSSVEALLYNSYLPYKQYVTEDWRDIDIKNKLNGFIDHSEKKDVILPLLEQMSENLIGDITLRVLYQARQNMPNQKLKISLQSYIFAKDGKTHCFGFAPNEFCIYLNLDKLNEAGAIMYLNNKIFPCHPYDADSYLFHELLHAFHYTLGNYKGNLTSALQHIYGQQEELKKLWTNDEELYTISGKFLTDSGLLYDPLNANLYEALKFHKQKYPGYIIPQRLFHIRHTLKTFDAVKELDWRHNLDKIVTNFADLGY